MKNIYVLGLFLLFLCLHSFSGVSQHKKENPEVLTLKVSKKDLSQNDLKDGQLKIQVSGGDYPYQIRCIGPEINIKLTDKDKIDLNNLIKGEYLIIVRDRLGNIRYETIEIN